MEEHRVTEHHRSFAESIHSEVRQQLMKFVADDGGGGVAWLPYAVCYYTELTPLCLRDSLTSGEDFIPLLTRCLHCAVYDIRLAALQYLVSILDNHLGDNDDKNADNADDYDDDFYLLSALGQSTAGSRELLLSRLVQPAAAEDSGIGVLVDMLLIRETHDECLLMVSS